MIRWSTRQRSRVVSVLSEHPATSHRCAVAAREILPTACEVDNDAHARLIEAKEALYVQPKGLDVRWFHHVTVSATAHYVDALTGPDGHEQSSYLERFFHEPDYHSVRRIGPDEGEWEGL